MMATVPPLPRNADEEDEAASSALKSAWRAEVCYRTKSEEIRWKRLEQWRAQYEDIGGKKASRARNKGDTSTRSSVSNTNTGGKSALILKLHEEMDTRVMDAVLVVLAGVMGIAEAEARRHHAAEDADTGSEADAYTSKSTAENEAISLSDTLPQFLNRLGALALTYRYERQYPTKFVYLRRLASDQTADLIRDFFAAFEDDPNAAAWEERTLQLRRQSKNLVDVGGDRVTGLMVQLLNESDGVARVADEALDGALAVTQQALDEAGEKIDAAGLGVARVGERERGNDSANIVGVDDGDRRSNVDVCSPFEDGDEVRDGSCLCFCGGWGKSGRRRPPIMEKIRRAVADGMEKIQHAIAGGVKKIQQARAEVKDELLGPKDKFARKIVRTLGGLIEETLTQGVSGLITSAKASMDQLLDMLAKAHGERLAQGGDVIDEEDLRDKTFHFIEGIYSDMKQRASADTGTAVQIMGAVLGKKQIAALVNRLQET